MLLVTMELEGCFNCILVDVLDFNVGSRVSHQKFEIYLNFSVGLKFRKCYAAPCSNRSSSKDDLMENLGIWHTVCFS
jgi:hypothetical protein